jgi:rRNA-processing protein FCF1
MPTPASRVEDLPTHPRLHVVHAPADGDTAIAALAADLAAQGDSVLVVTADRALRERVRGAGAGTIGPGALLEALPG